MQVSSVPDVDVPTQRFATNVSGQGACKGKANMSRNRVDGKHTRQAMQEGIDQRSDESC
jgi:hypothetical protein